MSELVIVVPTYGRPQKLGPLIENIAATTPPVYTVLLVLDPEDVMSWEEVEAMQGFRDQLLALEHAGTLPEKVNAGIRSSVEPWIFVTADDVVFHEGWWEATAALRVDRGLIGTNDLHNPATASGAYGTQLLFARWYVDEYGTVDELGAAFCEGYHHNCIDVEACETAQARGLYGHAPESIVEHLHFTTGLAPIDETYRRGCMTDTDRDEALLRERRSLWSRAGSFT